MNISILPETGPEPRSIRIYLRTHGWQREAESHDLPTVWTLPTSQGTFEVIAPSSRQNRDFSARVAELLRTISVVESRPPKKFSTICSRWGTTFNIFIVNTMVRRVRHRSAMQ
jgi:hypothetical protein